MKISPVLPVAFSTLLTVSLSAPLRLRYPSPAEAEKRADTFLQPKASSFDEQIHKTLDFGTGEPLLVRDLQKSSKRADSLSQAQDTEELSASEGPTSGSTSALGSGSSRSFDQAIHDTLNFGGTTDPLLFKKDALPQQEVQKREAAGSFDEAIHEKLNFGGATDPLVKKDVEEKRAESLPTASLGSPSNSLDSSIHDDLDFGGEVDPLMGGSSGRFLTTFRRAEAAVEGAAEKIARAFNA